MPTTNPVPSTDPSDLLFNAGKLDEVVNGTANSFTDRFGASRRTVAGMNADFDAQLADAESDLNVYRADAAASASQALGYLNVIRTTSYGAYASDPATDPLGNPPTEGDEYWNTTAKLLKRWNGTTWQASDINTANLAASSGSSLVGYDGGTVQDVLDAVTGPTGAASVGYMPAGTSAVATTVEAKLREMVTVTDHGAIADSGVTDNTAAIITLFSTLGAAYSGVIKIPYGVKYNFNTVAPLAPVRATIVDESSINAWNTPGFRQKVIGVWESGDPTAVTDTNFTISSGHNPTFVLENRGTSGSGSGDARVAPIAWSSGRFQTGEPGLRVMAKLQFGRSQFRSTLWSFVLRKLTTWAARNYEIWSTGKSFTTGDYTITGGRTYVAASSGVAGATQPTWTSGTASDGGVNWTYVELTQDSFIFGVDEHGRISTNASNAGGYTYRFKQNVMDTESVLTTFEGTGNNKAVTLRLVPTDASGNELNLPDIQGTTSGLLRLTGQTSGKVLFQADDDSFDLATMGRREVSAADGDTTPSVRSCGALVLSNTSPTSITTLDDGSSTQEVMLIFSNGNTTLVHSSSFRLKGGVNVTPSVLSIMVMKKYSGSTSWIEVSRNF